MTTAEAVGSVQAYAQLRAAIVESRYPPGYRLIETRLADDLGLSRTPIREALRRLEAEGLVVSEPNRGAMVRPLSATEVDDLYGLRIRLESYAVEVATERATEVELAELAAAATSFSAVRTTVDLDTIEGVRLVHEANRRLHDGILAAAQHRRLAAMLARTVDIPLVFQAFRTFGPAEIERSDTFHHLIVDAMARREASRAGALMAEHITQGRDTVLDLLARAEGRDPDVMPPTMTPADTENRRLCHALLDAIEAGDAKAVEALYDPELQFWCNFTMQTVGVAENLEALANGSKIQRRRTYNDRQIHTFEDGFMAQYSVNVVMPNGASRSLSACLVGRTRNGKITRMDEYMDSGRFR